MKKQKKPSNLVKTIGVVVLGIFGVFGFFALFWSGEDIYRAAFWSICLLLVFGAAYLIARYMEVSDECKRLTEELRRTERSNKSLLQSFREKEFENIALLERWTRMRVLLELAKADSNEAKIETMYTAANNLETNHDLQMIEYRKAYKEDDRL